MGEQPITWADDIEPAYDLLAQALGNLDTILKRRADLTEREAFRQGFVALNHGVESALNRLTSVHNRLFDAEPPARPLEAVLADIVAEGHVDITVTRLLAYASLPARWSVRTNADSEPWPGTEGTTREQRQEWRVRVETGEAEAETPTAAAEARLAQVRELHAEKLERDGLAADVPDDVKQRALDAASVHFGHAGEPVCGAENARPITTKAEQVTCPDCRAWLDLNAIARTADEVDAPNEAALATEERRRAREASEGGEGG